MRRLAIFALCVFSVPCVAFAHGEQVLAFPLGQGAAMIVVPLLMLVLKMNARWKIGAAIAAIVAGVISWFIPGLYRLFMDWFGLSGWPWFALGFLVPVLATLSVFFASRYFRHDS